MKSQEEFPADLQAEFDSWHKKYLVSYDDEAYSTGPGDPGSMMMNRPYFPPSAAAAATPGKTRLRISFCSEEVTRLQRWFEIDPHPSRHAMTKYLAELNELPARGAGLKPLDLTNIMYWFKNARAAARRNGKSVGSDDLSEDEGGPGDGEIPAPTTIAPPLPNSNAVYVIKDPLVKQEEDCDTRGNGSVADEQMIAVADNDALGGDESDMDDLSVTDDESEINDGETYQSSEKHPTNADSLKEDMESTKQDASLGVSPTASSPKVPTNFVTPRLPGYPFPYSSFPMAYLQSQINPFYKDWNEKLQSAVAAHAQATTAQQNMSLMKPEPMKPESEMSKAERQKRHRAFIDPVSEIPKLEQWFTKDTHPSHYVIEQICEDLNRGEFRSRYPKLSPKNIQLWFKNHRAKVKRMRVGGGSLSFSSLDSGQMKMSPSSGLSMSVMEGV